ncbi:MAG: endonuclease V [Anaerolineae bacterium]|nr:MAG: endonuclease V [Anaerolineae bacterium]
MEPLHDWNPKPEEAIRIQDELRRQLRLRWDGREVHTIGGVDVGLNDDRARCAIVLLRYPDLVPFEAAVAEVELTFPYIPGLLSFREGPAVLAAWEKLPRKPDLLFFDGQGIAHPRGMGIAAQMGLWLQVPTIGVAKSRLYGIHTTPGPRRGDRTKLLDEREPGRVIGAVLRTRDHVRPVYVSPGHLMDVAHAVKFTLAACAGYRLPEPTRWAHKVAGGAELPPESPRQERLL